MGRCLFLLFGSDHFNLEAVGVFEEDGVVTFATGIRMAIRSQETDQPRRNPMPGDTVVDRGGGEP